MERVGPGRVSVFITLFSRYFKYFMIKTFLIVLSRPLLSSVLSQEATARTGCPARPAPCEPQPTLPGPAGSNRPWTCFRAGDAGAAELQGIRSPCAPRSPSRPVPTSKQTPEALLQLALNPQAELLLSVFPCTWPGVPQPPGHLSPSQLGSRTESLLGPGPAWHRAPTHLLVRVISEPG